MLVFFWELFRFQAPDSRMAFLPPPPLRPNRVKLKNFSDKESETNCESHVSSDRDGTNVAEMPEALAYTKTSDP